MIPDWAPNLHPMVVHFPVALLLVAVIVDALSLFWRERLAFTATVLYVLGGVGTLAGYLSGRAAAASVMVSGKANVVLSTHADWGTAALWFFGVYALVRIAVAWKAAWGRRRAVHIPLIAVAAAGLFVLYKTADNGARLVFEHGVGVQAVQSMAKELEVSRRATARLQGQAELPVVEEDGSWRWTPGPFAAEAFTQGFVLEAGSFEVGGAQDTALALVPARSPALFVLDEDLASVQADWELGMEGFEGSVQLVYNLTDSLHFCFTEFADGRVRQGCAEPGSRDIMVDHPFVPGQWVRFRVVSDRTHFRAYADGKMIIHAHGPAPEAGRAGLRLEGRGTVLVGSIEVVSLR